MGEKITDAEFTIVRPAKRVWFDWRPLAIIIVLAVAAAGSGHQNERPRPVHHGN